MRTSAGHYAALVFAVLTVLGCNQANQQKENKSDSLVSSAATMYYGGDIIT